MTHLCHSYILNALKVNVNILTKNLAVEFAPNIRVNAIAPGWVNTEMNKLLDEEFSYSESTYPYYAIWWKVTYNNGYTASYICSIRYNVDGLKDKDYNARN